MTENEFTNSIAWAVGIITVMVIFLAMIGEYRGQP